MAFPRAFALPLAALLLLALVPAAAAVHWYRSTNGGCSVADGALTDPGSPAPGPTGSTVLLMHNAFHDLTTGAPVTVVRAGESVTWEWASLHCHSASSGTFLADTSEFDSGFHYPVEPGFPRAVSGFFEYPVPSLAPTLSYTHTFTQPGTYLYYCVHHAAIGMNGVVVVQ